MGPGAASPHLVGNAKRFDGEPTILPFGAAAVGLLLTRFTDTGIAMNLPRAIALMLAGLAVGTGVRLAFTLPAEPSIPDGAGVTERSVSQPSGGGIENPGPRPDEQDILNARGGKRLRLLLAWLTGSDGDELLRMADALAISGPEENLSVRLLMARWAEVNPEAMIVWARAQRDESRAGEFFADNAIEAWARVDFDNAWAAAAAMPFTRGSALLGLTAVDPDKCLRFLNANPSLLDLTGFTDMADVINRLAAREPSGTAALLGSGPQSRFMKFANGVALAWAKSDPAAAIEWLENFDGSVRSALAESAGKWIAAHAPEQLPTLLARLPAGRARGLIEAAGVAQLAASDPAAARRQIDGMPAGPLHQYCRGLVMMELLRGGDDSGAAALAAQMGWNFRNYFPSDGDPSDPMRRFRYGEEDAIKSSLRELLSRIAEKDPREAATGNQSRRPGRRADGFEE
jgi:hypothetical protein